MKNIESQPIIETSEVAVEPGVSPEELLRQEQEALEQDEAEVESSRLELKLRIGKLLKVGYAAVLIINLLAGTLGKAKAEEIVSQVDTGDKIVQVDEPPDTEISDIEYPKFNIDEINRSINNISKADISEIESLRGPDYFVIDEDGVIEEGPMDEVRQESEEIRTKFINGNISANEAVISNLNLIEQNPDHKDVLTCINRIESICLKHGLLEVGKDISILFFEKYGNFYEDEEIFRLEMHDAFKFFNLSASQLLDAGDVDGAIAVYYPLLKSENSSVNELANYHVKALNNLPDNYAELDDVQKKVEEARAYVLVNPEFQRFLEEYEDQEDFKERFSDSMRSLMDFERIHSQAEELFNIKLSENDPVVRLENIDDAVGKYLDGNYNVATAISDTIKVDIDYFEKHARADYQTEHTNIPENLLIELKERIERKIKLIVTHEKFHDWGYFKTVFGGERELFNKDALDHTHHTEGLTDLLARYMNKGEENLGIGYPTEVANWGNLSYILGYEEGKESEVCFDEGVRFLAKCFLEDYSVRPIFERLSEISGEDNEIESLATDLLLNDNNPGTLNKILHGGKIKKIVELARLLGINLEENQDNLGQLGLNEEVIEKSLSEEVIVPEIQKDGILIEEK